jgi:outer membrane protein insertion porin family
MRLSPTLLACCTLTMLVGIPCRVLAEDLPTAPTTLTAASVDAAQLPVADATPVVTASDSELESEAHRVNANANAALATADIAPAPVEPKLSPSNESTIAVSIDIANADPVPAQASADEPASNAAPSVSPNLAPNAAQPVAQNTEENRRDRLERLRDGINRPPAAGETPPTTGETPPTSSTPTPPSDPTENLPPATGETPAEPEETRVLVSEVAVVSESGGALPTELVDTVYNAVQTEPGRTTTRSQLQEDINDVFATGFFANVRAQPEDTPLGVRVTFVVQPNPVLTQVQVRDNEVLPPEVVDEIFRPQYGQILNLLDFQDGILELNDWYQTNGYVLAQVTAAPQVSADGIVTLIVAEGVIESIDVRYITAEGETTDEEGNPIDGRTHAYIVTREFESQPGDVFQQSAIQADLQRVFGLGIFDDVRLSLDPGDNDPRKVKVVVNVAERNTGSVGAAVGFNLTGDVFGSVSYQQDNFGGNNQRLRTEIQLSARDLLFDVSFTDPWIGGDANRTSYTVNAFNRRSVSLIFDNGTTPVELANGDTPRINRLGGGLSFTRPFDNGWTGSVGVDYQRVSSRDSGGRINATDELGNPLTFSGTGQDDLLTIPLGFVLDRRNNSTAPTSGSILRIGTEQSIPLGLGSVFFNRIRGSYSQYIPVNFTGFGDGPETLAINFQAGTVLGDLPPYEAFSLGGTNSVRGYEEGDLGSGRSYVLATAEYRFPLFTSFLGGALFLDFGSDLGSGSSVLGDPAGIRGKDGTGFGYGAGLRVQTPLGNLRLDYGFNDDGDSRIHFGFGERF